MTPRVPVLNGGFDALTLAEVVDWASAWIRDGRRGYLCTVNVAILMMMRRDLRLQRVVDRAALVVADGRPIVWCSRLAGRRLPERVAGIDLIDALAARAARDGFGLYLLGARRAVVENAARRLLAAHPGLSIRGVADGYFRAGEAAERARAVRQSGASLLLIGMGVPRQEYFLEEQWAELGVNLAIGVGGSFEVLAGARRRAPHWAQQAGLEWLWRLIQEPRRLGPRYVDTNCRFIAHIARDIIATRVLKRVPA
jgi:N-acetylglucosaminyldiphosphoundecaprenol N-acetyl-beta-D-mannosaminyltransferase